MGKNKRRFSSQTRAFNERLLNRSYSRWGDGLISDQFETPSNGFAKLHNARDHQEEVRGRRGSFLWTPANIGVKITSSEAGQTLSEAMQSGVIYAANNNSLPKINDIFQVYNWRDFVDNSLISAKRLYRNYKTPLVQAYDLFRVINNVSGSEEIEHIGNLSYPPFQDWYSKEDDTPSNLELNISASDAENGIYAITFLSGSEALGDVSELKGNYCIPGYFGGGDDLTLIRFFITDVEGNTLTAKGPKNFSDLGSYQYGYFQAPIYASHWSSLKKKIYIHTGKKIYSSGVDFNGWKEVPGIYKNPLTEAEGEIGNNNNTEFLINYSGIFYIKDDSEESFYFKLNSDKPEESVAVEPVRVFGLWRPEYDTEGGNIIQNDIDGNSNNPILVQGFPGKSPRRANGGIGIGRRMLGGTLL